MSRSRGMVFSLAYWSMCRLLELLVLRRRTEREKEIEILLLRHQLRVLERQVARPQLTQADRALMAAFSRVLPGRACKFIVSGNWAEFRTPQGIGLLRDSRIAGKAPQQGDGEERVDGLSPSEGLDSPPA